MGGARDLVQTGHDRQIADLSWAHDLREGVPQEADPRVSRLEVAREVLDLTLQAGITRVPRLK